MSRFSTSCAPCSRSSTPCPSISLISVSADHEGTIRLDGWVTQGGANVEVHLDPHPLSLAAKPDRVALADAHGRFVIDALAHGRVVFVVRQHPERADDRPVITPSIEL